MTQTKFTDSGISLTTNLYAVKEMLKHAEPHIVLDKVAKQVTMPKNKRQQIQFRRPVPFSANTAPLTEGVTPNATAFAYETVNATLNQYGEYVEITDVIEDTAEDPVLKDATMILGENLGRSREALLYSIVKAGTSVSYANGASRSAVNTAITVNGIRGVIRSLRANKAKPVTRILDGSPNENTTPVESAYVAFCHTDVAADIRSLSGFRPVAEYGSRKTISDNELGSFEDVRFVCSADLTPFEDAGGSPGSMKSTSGSSADVYPIIFMGQDAFGAVTLKGSKSSGMNSVQLLVNPVGKVDSSDPLAQRGTIGYKTWFTGIRLNETWLERLEVAVTDL